MSDEIKKNEDELVLDWDDALDDWGKDLTKAARAESAPLSSLVLEDSAAGIPTQVTPVPSVFPTIPPELAMRTDPAPAPVTTDRPAAEKEAVFGPTDTARYRMLYRPPSAEEVRAMQAHVEKTLPPARDVDSGDSADDTRIATVPRELIESLARLDTADRELKVRSISVTNDDDVDLENAPRRGPDADTDPSGLVEREGSGVFGPSSIKPSSTAVTSRPPPSEEDEPDSTRVLELNEVDFDEEERTTLTTTSTQRTLSNPPPVPVDARAEESVLRNLEELAPPVSTPVVPPSGVTTVRLSIPPAVDRGATTAMNTMRTRKPRPEHMPLVGVDDAAKRARVGLLSALSAHANGAQAARLFVQAGELLEELGETKNATALYERALEAAPGHSEALIALSRIALAQRDVGGYAQALERTVAQSSSTEIRARMLEALARVRILIDGDLSQAMRAVTEAQQLCQTDPSILMTQAQLEAVATPGAYTSTHESLAQVTLDQELRAALLGTSARRLAARGEHAPAAQLFHKAVNEHPAALDVYLGLAQALSHMPMAQGAPAALASAANLSDALARTALERQAARLNALSPDERAHAARTALEAGDPASLRTAAQLAMRTEDGELQRAVADAWVAASTGSEKALALLMLAEIESSAGQSDASEQALMQASNAAPDMRLVSVVREMLARRRGDRATLARAIVQDESAQSALTAAAKLCLDASESGQELAFLVRAQESGDEALCSEALLLDAASEAKDFDRVRLVLEAQASHQEADAAAQLLATLADLERRSGRTEERREALRRALLLVPRSTLVGRALVRATSDGEARSEFWRKEAEQSRGVRAAFAHLRSGHALADDAHDKLLAFTSAYEAAPGYPPSTWTLHHEARRRSDLSRLADLHGREAGRAKDPLEAVAHLVRAALIRAAEDTDGAAAQLARALDLVPTDPVLRELVLRLGDAVPATLRAEAMQRAAEHAPPQLKRAALLGSAGAFEDANQPQKACELYEAVLATSPHDHIALMGFDRVAPASGKGDGKKKRLEARVEAAQSPLARAKALEELFALDRSEAPEQAEARARELLSLSPEHPVALRELERHAMNLNDAAGLLRIERELVRNSRGSRDRAARLRMFACAQFLTDDPLSVPDRLDELLLDPNGTFTSDPWTVRHLLDAAIQTQNTEALERADNLMLGCTHEPIEIVCSMITRSRGQMAEHPEAIARELGEAIEKHPSHPLGAEAFAEASLRAGDTRKAAESFEIAAKISASPARAARLWYRAGRLFQEELQAVDRARDAFRATAEHDVAYADVQMRLESLLTGRNDVGGLIALTEARLKTGGPPEQLVELHRSLAKLYEKRGDKTQARASLRDALAVLPEHLPTLRDYSQLAERDKEWREAAEALIRLARLSRDPNELRDVFFRLGEVYDLHLPDARRAEAAYRRVLKLGPKHTKALERLAALYRREQQIELAVQALERLVQVAETPARKREVAFELSRLKEDTGDPRGAEEALEGVRRTAPTDLYVLRGLADFYRRQNSGPALAMHLNRAANDLVKALADDLDDAGLHSALVEVLEQRGRRDAASACASVAYALGLADANVVAHTDNEGNIQGLGGAAFSELLDDLVYPESLHPAVRVVFRYGAEALNKTAPFDIKGFGAEKLDKKHPLRGAAQELARWIGASEIEIYVTDRSPNAFVPVQDSPVVLLVGRTLLESLTRGEQQFLIARALKLAKAQLSVVCRVRPDELALMMQGLIRSQLPDFAPEGVDSAQLEEMSRRVGKNLSRKAREELLPHLIELAGETNLDLTRTYEVASEAANRAALLATGAAPSAVSALHKLAGLPGKVRPNAATLSQVVEARDLVLFAVSEAHFEARQRAGVDRR